MSTEGRTALTGEDLEELEVENVHFQITEFIKKLLPQAILLREFNGNYVY